MKTVVTEKYYYPVLGVLVSTLFLVWVCYFAYDFFSNIAYVRDAEMLDMYIGDYRKSVVISGLLSVYVWFYKKKRDGALASFFIDHPIVPLFVAVGVYLGVMVGQSVVEHVASKKTKECALVASAISPAAFESEGMNSLQLTSATGIDTHPFVRKFYNALMPSVMCMAYGLPEIEQAFPANVIFESVEAKYFAGDMSKVHSRIRDDQLVSLVTTTTPELKAELYKGYQRIRSEKNYFRKKGMLLKADEVIEEKVGFLDATDDIVKVLRRAVRDKHEWDEETFNKAIIKERRTGKLWGNQYGVFYSELKHLDHAAYKADGDLYRFHNMLKETGVKFKLWPTLLGSEEAAEDMLNSALLRVISPYAVITLLAISILSSSRSIGFFVWRCVFITVLLIYERIRMGNVLAVTR